MAPGLGVAYHKPPSLAPPSAVPSAVFSPGASFCPCQPPNSTRRKNRKPGNCVYSVNSTNTSSTSTSWSPDFVGVTALLLPSSHRQRFDPSGHAPEQPPCEMALGQHQPVVSGVLDQPTARATAAANWSATSSRSSPAAPAAARGFPIGDQAQPEAHFIRPEPMATQPRHLHHLLAFLDPLLRRAPLVVTAAEAVFLPWEHIT